MSSEHWRAVDDLFHAAIERTRDARPAFSPTCSGNDELLREVCVTAVAAEITCSLDHDAYTTKVLHTRVRTLGVAVAL